MNIFITYGTIDFMRKLIEKHPSETMIVMNGEGTSLLLHETNGKTVFQTPRRYEVIGSSGDLGEDGYFVFNNIPVTDEGRPVFEHRFKQRAGAIDSEPGFIAFRLLRPLDSSTYIVLTQWENQASFKKWENSAAFEQAHAKNDDAPGVNKAPQIFASASYVTSYQTAKRKEDEEKT